jgi:uncharacterized RDD family membrane protein YckC
MEKYQTFWQRFAASLLDGIIFLPIFLIIPSIFNIDTVHSVPWLLFINFISFFYSIYAHSYYGYTLGKKWMNIKVVSNDDESKLIGLSNSIMRDSIGIAFFLIELILVISNTIESRMGDFIIFLATFGWLFAELITMLLNPKKRSVHDFLAGSVVIHIAKPNRLQ